MRIYLDGCDGTGKSSLADYLARRFRLDKFCLTKDSEKSVLRYLEIRQTNNTVYDRTFVSEIVYPQVFNRKEWMTERDKEILFTCYLDIEPDDIFIILTADIEDIYNRILLRSSEEYPEILKNIKLINDKYLEIAHQYNIPVINTSEIDIKKITQLIERRELW